jgi:ESX secretion system protein EccD
VDAVATATNERAGRWRPALTRTFGLTLAVVALLGGAAAIFFSGPPNLLAGIVGLSGGVALLMTGVVLSRGFGKSPAGVIFALVGLVYLAVGGLLIGAGDRTFNQLGAPHFLIAAGIVFVGSALAVVGVAHGGPVFLAVDVCAGALLLATAICFVFGAPASGGAAVLAAVSFAFLPMLPMLAYRLARLPIPSVPTGPDDLKSDTSTVDGARVLARSERADEFLAALLGALAVIGFGCGLVVAVSGGLAGVILAAVLGLLMLIRARWFISRRQRLPLLIAGAVTLAFMVIAIYVPGSQVTRLFGVTGLLLITGAAGTGVALSGAEQRRSPVGGRMLDILEVLLIVAVVPLAIWASGLYGWVRSLNG